MEYVLIIFLQSYVCSCGVMYEIQNHFIFYR